MLSELDITWGLFGVFYGNLNWAQNWAQMQKNGLSTTVRIQLYQWCA